MSVEDNYMRGAMGDPLVDRATFGQQVSSLDKREFEQFICDVFDHRGWETELTQATRDGGYDVYLERTGNTKIVEAKRSQKVGPHVIKAAAGCALKHDTQEVAVVALSFTSGAKSAAEDIEKNSHLTIELYSLTNIHRSLWKMGRTDLIEEYAADPPSPGSELLENW